jgi:lactate permease
MQSTWFLASFPVLVILLTMLVFRWSAVRAGPAAWAAAVLIAFTRFAAPLETLAWAQLKALLITLDVLLIVWSAFLLYRVAAEAGAISRLAAWVPRLTHDRGLQALIIGWAFASFLQGVGGFGVPTAVTAPILLGLGFSPVAAVAIPSIGHAWSVTFGSLASSFQALQAATDLSWQSLAPSAAFLLAIACLACGLAVAHLAGGWTSIRHHALGITCMALAMGGAQYLLAVSGAWVIAGLGGGAAGMAVGLLLASNRREPNGDGRGALFDRDLALSLAGFAALVVITLLFQIPSIHAALGGLVIRIASPPLTTGLGYQTPAGYGRQIFLLRHAGSILVYSSVFAYRLYRRTGALNPGAWRPILSSTVKNMLPSSFGILTLVSMALIMNHAGMTDALASAIASAAGSLYPLVSPWLGALGAFMTGSNTNSNVVFAQLQQRTAQLLGLSVPIILAAQTSGGALGSVIAPAKIIVGTATVGLTGSEGLVLRRTLSYTVLLLILMSITAVILLG